MPARQCHHCKRWIEQGEAHTCPASSRLWAELWGAANTTEAALTADLSEDLRDAWERLRETAVSFGEQRIYASHRSIMFSRKSCYFFVRPQRSFLELWVYLGRALKAPQVCRVDRTSKSKFAHFIRIRHRDEVEPPITDWLREAYEFSAASPTKSVATTAKPKQAKPIRKARSL
jgi:Domain of unknown function (DUF5655)